MRIVIFSFWLCFSLFANDLALETWARETHTPDLSGLEAFVGESKVFGFGESHHGLAEPNETRNRIFARLVETEGFRAIILESGFLEAKLVDRYIQGDNALSLREVLEKGFTHGMGEYEESRDLVEWMRSYNASHEEKIHFFGLDLSLRGDYPRLPLETIRPYLMKVAPEYVTTHLDPLLALAREASSITDKVEAAYQKIGKKFIEPDLLDCFTTISFEAMSPAKQNELELGVKRLVDSFSTIREKDFDYEWNRQVAVQASQMLRNLRSRQAYPKIVGFGKSIELLNLLYKDPVTDLNINLNHLGEQSVADLKSYFKGRETRELSEAENIRWIQQLQGKVMVFAQNGHLMKSQADIVVGDLHVGKNGGLSAGDFVNQMFGKDYVFLASTIDDLVDGTGKIIEEHAGIPVVPTSSCKDCIERPLSALGDQVPSFLLDFRKASGEALTELDRDRETRWDFIGFQRLNLREAYDGIFFVKRATLAVPLR